MHDILKNYSQNNPGSRNNLARMLMHGKLCGTGKLLILPVDQGFEHGPDDSFSMNENAYNPEYHIKLAIECGLSAYAAPIGMIEDVAHKYPGQIPLILKLNSASRIFPKSDAPNQSFIATPKDALKLGCVGIGLTVYPGSPSYREMLEKSSKIISEAKSYGLVVVIWSYPRGGDLKTKDETALDIISYAAHMACLIGADIVKVKLPTEYLSNNNENIKNITELSDRVNIIKRSCFDRKRLVLFSGGKNKDLDDLYNEVKAIKKGGGDGSIIGRNAFQRSKKDAIEMLSHIINIYKN
jgi:class I fructose-bisphosphate aldolase